MPNKINVLHQTEQIPRRDRDYFGLVASLF
ncbi:Hypothetical protein EpJSE_00174 [Escherichia phage JSE]|uniref:Uncharacterized protein n=1 Tax=Escherichia phage JSE TaxID=576789 RepID=C4MYZ2_9CAUD|nr:hypothetical protein EpJSE_00174 [Escherichia phage JSE]ACL78123.1 Hypothetical protein EpJSE_00174 [Escherichia phage JSE]